MKSDVTAYSFEDSLLMRRDKSNPEDPIHDDVMGRLFQRWRNGTDLKLLSNILKSNRTEERISGAYYLGEAIPPGNDLKATAIRLASDPLSYCRRAFVIYMTNSGLYDETIAIRLAKCLADFDLDVRLETINWAVFAPDDRFDDFSRLVDSASGITDSKYWRKPELRRATRGLTIARRLRDGESVEEIRKTTQEEDSFTFDYLQFFENRLKRYVEKRKNNPLNTAVSTPTGAHDYEIGVVGEKYDNRGKLMSAIEDLPQSVPPELTSAQLADLIARANEAIRQREYDEHATGGMKGRER